MEQFIDPDSAMRSHGSFNLTHYFEEMSLGKFHLIGDPVWVETAHSQEEYRNGSYGRANTDILRERVDSLVDFSRYDEWTLEGPYKHSNAPDGQVDMIVMVWRTNIFEYLGEASLGYKPGFEVDGKRIEMGFPENIPYPLGSGVTCEYPYTDSPYQAMQTVVHELSHWLLGGLHPYNGKTLSGKHAYWGMLCNGLRTGSCANAYDRERLGWIVVPDIPPDVEIQLPDYVRTGVAYKYHPPNGDPLEYFYLENHQQLSVFDDITRNPAEKGLWILHQQGPYIELDNLRIRPSDGNWKWENPRTTSECFSQPLPLFRRGEPRVLTGETHRDQIPTQTSVVNWMYAFEDATGQPVCGAFFRGQMLRGAFDVAMKNVFSPFSNPNSNTWNHQPTAFSLEIVNDSAGVLALRSTTDPPDAPPAARYLGMDPTLQDAPQGSLSLAWGTQWTEGQPLEPDVDWSELQRQLGSAGSWNTVYEGPSTSWGDESATFDSSGTLPVLFRVRVRDTQGKYSLWSNLFRTAIVSANAVEEGPGLSAGFALGANYPNPFNPTTTIQFTLGTSTDVSLKLYNLVGQEVKTIIPGERLSAGSYLRSVSADGLASGVYIYRLVTPQFTKSRKLIVLR